MSQWGKPRVFSSATASIVALPDVEMSGPFDPINLESKIWQVLISNTDGDKDEIARLTAEAKSYVGRPYSEWFRDPDPLWTPKPGEDYEKRTELQRVAV